MADCPKCGRAMGAAAKFCMFCGKPDIVYAPPSPRDPAHESAPGSGALKGAAGVAAGVAGEAILDIAIGAIGDLLG